MARFPQTSRQRWRMTPRQGQMTEHSLERLSRSLPSDIAAEYGRLRHYRPRSRRRLRSLRRSRSLCGNSFLHCSDSGVLRFPREVLPQLITLQRQIMPKTRRLHVDCDRVSRRRRVVPGVCGSYREIAAESLALARSRPQRGNVSAMRIGVSGKDRAAPGHRCASARAACLARGVRTFAFVATLAPR